MFGSAVSPSDKLKKVVYLLGQLAAGTGHSSSASKGTHKTLGLAATEKETNYNKCIEEFKIF